MAPAGTVLIRQGNPIREFSLGSILSGRPELYWEAHVSSPARNLRLHKTRRTWPIQTRSCDGNRRRARGSRVTQIGGTMWSGKPSRRREPRRYFERR